MRSRHLPRPLAALLLSATLVAPAAAAIPARAAPPVDVRHGAPGMSQPQADRRLGGAVRVFFQPQGGRMLAHDSLHGRPHRLDHDDVLRRLRWAGYTNISRPEYRRGGYVARADDRFGNRRLLQVDPHTGVIRRLRETRRPWW